MGQRCCTYCSTPIASDDPIGLCDECVKKGPNDWAHDCQKWRGKLLTGRQGHWCDEWDGLPVDETCPEWPCGCAFQFACEKPVTDKSEVVEALQQCVDALEYVEHYYPDIGASFVRRGHILAAKKALAALPSVETVTAPSAHGRGQPPSWPIVLHSLREIRAALTSAMNVVATSDQASAAYVRLLHEHAVADGHGVRMDQIIRDIESYLDVPAVVGKS